ncbi:MAG: hypothetical protein P1U88_15325 [Thalassobaculaceae bacterium]|nr:hypothetical protein [Thalassobaculaceae bacterium]
MRSRAMTGLATAMLCACLAGAPSAEARSPLLFFRGVERIALFCGRPLDSELREKLCATARTSLQDLSGTEVTLGTGALSDPNAITVLVNGYPVAGPNGPVFVIDIGMLRKDHVDGRLFGAPPILVGVRDVVTKSSDVADKLKAHLSELVVGPWRQASPLATPTGTNG